MDSTKFERTTTIVIRRGFVFLLSGSVFFVRASGDGGRYIRLLIFSVTRNMFLNFILASSIKLIYELRPRVYNRSLIISGRITVGPGGVAHLKDLAAPAKHLF